MKVNIKTNKMDTITREHGQKICNMEKEKSFIKEMGTLLKVSSCMEVSLDKESILLMMDEFMKDTFITVTAMVWAG